MRTSLGQARATWGVMQPEGRPQQGKLTIWNKKGIHAAGTDPRDLGMMRPCGRSQLKTELREMSPDAVEDEVMLKKRVMRGEDVDPHEPPGPGASGGSWGTRGSPRAISISTRTA